MKIFYGDDGFFRVDQVLDSKSFGLLTVFMVESIRCADREVDHLIRTVDQVAFNLRNTLPPSRVVYGSVVPYLEDGLRARGVDPRDWFKISADVKVGWVYELFPEFSFFDDDPIGLLVYAMGYLDEYLGLLLGVDGRGLVHFNQGVSVPVVDFFVWNSRVLGRVRDLGEGDLVSLDLKHDRYRVDIDSSGVGGVGGVGVGGGWGDGGRARVFSAAFLDCLTSFRGFSTGPLDFGLGVTDGVNVHRWDERSLARAGLFGIPEDIIAVRTSVCVKDFYRNMATKLYAYLFLEYYDEYKWGR